MSVGKSNLCVDRSRCVLQNLALSVEEALALLDAILTPNRLSQTQEIVFRQCWQGKTYQEIAESADYDADYIRVVGARLWHELSEYFGERITKSNFRSVLRQQWRARNESRVEGTFFEFPRGQVPLNSPFYIERPPIELQCYQTIVEPGALIRIEAPRQMGKTSLMARILQRAREHGMRTVTLSLQLASTDVFTDLNRFLRWFCAAVTRALEKPDRLQSYWDDIFGSNYNTTDYFENYLLKNIETPLVLALDEVDMVFEHPEIATDFFGLLRAWYEKAKYGDARSAIWQKLRLVVVHSTEVYIPLEINRSPFNVGISVELPSLTLEQVRDLAARYELNWQDLDKESSLRELLNLVGGNPYLIRLALYHLKHQELDMRSLLQTAATEEGIYSARLRQQLEYLQQYPHLATAFARVVRTSTPVEIDPVTGFKLQSLGLVKLQNHRAIASCQLYRQYFSLYLETN